jgi:hypothetical protein
MHRFLRESNREGRRSRRYLLRNFQCGLKRVALRDDAADQAEALCLWCVNEPTGQHQVYRLGSADGAGEALRPARTRPVQPPSSARCIFAGTTDDGADRQDRCLARTWQFQASIGCEARCPLPLPKSQGLARNLRLSLNDSFDNNARFIDESIEPPAGDRIAVSVDHKSDFEKLWGPTL